MEKILFIYLPTGSGHQAPCNAIADKIKELYPDKDICTYMLYPFVNSNKKVSRFLIEKFYKFISTDGSFLWKYIYSLQQSGMVIKYLERRVTKEALKPVLSYIKENKITKIVSSHFLLNTVLLQASKEKDLDIDILTIITDPFTVPSIWARSQVADCIVFSDKAKKEFILNYKRLNKNNLNIPEIKVFNPVIHSKFEKIQKLQNSDRLKIASKYNINPNLLTILFVGGAEGFPNGKSFLKKISKIRKKINVIFVAGRNINQQKYALSLKSKDVNLHVFGYVDFLQELISISDLSVIKAGASTVFENVKLQKPMIVSSYLHYQELGTKNFVVDNNFGWYIDKPTELAKHLEKLDSNQMDKIKKNLENYNLEIGTKDIADYILNHKSKKKE